MRDFGTRFVLCGGVDVFHRLDGRVNNACTFQHLGNTIAADQHHLSNVNIRNLILDEKDIIVDYMIATPSPNYPPLLYGYT